MVLEFVFLMHYLRDFNKNLIKGFCLVSTGQWEFKGGSTKCSVLPSLRTAATAAASHGDTLAAYAEAEGGGRIPKLWHSLWSFQKPPKTLKDLSV